MKPEFLLRVSPSSPGAALRLFKAVRLWLLYRYTARNQCWRRSTRQRYESAAEGMREMIRRIIRCRWPGYTHWEVKILGSHKVVDLQSNRGLEFLVILSERPDE